MKFSAHNDAEQFLHECRARGFHPSIRNGCIHILKLINPGDRVEFANAESDSWALLQRVPTTRPGSTWGTDGLSVGGLSAMEGGLFQMNKSGVSIRFLNALAKLL